MVIDSESVALGFCVQSGEGWHCVFASFSGNEEGLCEWQVSICCDGVSKVKLDVCVSVNGRASGTDRQEETRR